TGAAPNVCSDWRDEIRERIHERVGGVADRVARGQWRQQRQYQVRPGPDAINRKGLSGVRIVLLETEPRGYVEESCEADRGIEQKPRKLLAGSREPGLQNLVHEPPRHCHVVERICQTLAHGLWQRCSPNLGGGLQLITIENV